MSISIKDIARIAGVSHSTVSRALSQSHLVNSETAERIRQLADELGYTPSAIGRSLVTRRTHTIGLVVTRLTDPFVAEVAQTVELTALDHGYSVLFSSAGEPDRELAAVRMLRERRVDGIVVMSSVVGASYMSLLSELQVPIVLINNQHDGHYVYSVGCDNTAGAKEVVSYLIRHGHQRIAYIPGPLEAVASGERRLGWEQALTEVGLPYGEAWVAQPAQGGGTPLGGEMAAAELLNHPNAPTAIFCYNDLTALGVLKVARSLGKRVPTDLSVVGFDDIALAAYTDPPLTTLAQPKPDLGQRAVEMLLTLLKQDSGQRTADGAVISQNGAPIARATLLPGRLVERGSVASLS